MPPTTPLTEDSLRAAGIGSVFRPGQLSDLGISHDQLSRLVAAGTVEQLARGLYRLTAADITENHSLATACARTPVSIVCLLSALKVHGIGTQLPHQVWLAIPHKARAPIPVLDQLHIVRFSGPAWTFGVVDTEFEGVPARITNPARTIVDCFRYERLVGREAALEALRDGLQRRLVTADALRITLETLPSRSLHEALRVVST